MGQVVDKLSSLNFYFQLHKSRPLKCKEASEGSEDDDLVRYQPVDIKATWFQKSTITIAVI